MPTLAQVCPNRAREVQKDLDPKETLICILAAPRLCSQAASGCCSRTAHRDPHRPRDPQRPTRYCTNSNHEDLCVTPKGEKAQNQQNSPRSNNRTAPEATTEQPQKTRGHDCRLGAPGYPHEKSYGYKVPLHCFSIRKATDIVDHGQNAEKV